MQCPVCGSRASAGARFCDQCGARLESPTDAFRPGDRRVVTALFADLVGYTRLVAELDAEEVRRRVDLAFGLLAGSVGRFGGTLEKFIGDAVFAVFGAPQAHDDDAIRATLCALAMRSALATSEVGANETPLLLRIGIATGEVVSGVRDVAGMASLALTGDPVTTAARLQQLAEPGEILVDAATVTAAGARLETDPLPTRILRGQRRSQPIYRLVADRGPIRTSHGQPARIVGRAAERALLRAALAEIGPGTGRAILVIGEAGIGKSALLADLERDARAAGFGWTWAENVSYGTGQPFRLVRRIVEELSEEAGTDAGTYARELLFTEAVDVATQRRQAGAIAALARDAQMDGWEAEAPLAPTDPKEIATALTDLAVSFTVALMARGPRVMIIDDLHWADPASLPLIDAEVRSIAGLPGLVLVGTRPGPRPPWARLPHVRVLDLRGLDAAATSELAAQQAGAQLSATAGRWLFTRTAGNPLFVGETVRALLEGGSLAPDGGELDLVAGDGGAPLPMSLRGLLGARIDALPPGPRATLEVASVVGMSFEERLVADLLERPVDADDLRHLVAADLLAALEAPGTWRFRHPLYHDAAYAGLLASRRRVLHARLADRLETEAIRPPIDVLAMHRAAAGDAARAIPLLDRAAEAALSLGAVVEAAGFWREAAQLVGPSAEAEQYQRRANEALVAAGRPIRNQATSPS